MPTALAQISVLIVVLILASVSSAFDVGNCNSCPSDCDVTYMAVGGDVIASYSCITYSWRSGSSSSCRPLSDDAQCSDYLYSMPECYSSKRGVGSDSKCDSASRPTPTQCYTQVGCSIGERCKNNACEALEYGFCEKDADCSAIPEKPYCSRKGLCDESGATTAQVSFLFIIAVVIIGFIAF